MQDLMDYLRPAEEPESPLDLPPPPPPPDPSVDVDLQDFLLGLDSDTTPFLVAGDTLCPNAREDGVSLTAFARDMGWVDASCATAFDAPVSASFSSASTRDSPRQEDRSSPEPSSLPAAHCCSCVERSLAVLEKLFSCPRKQSVQREAVDHTLGVLNHFTSHAWTVLDCAACLQSRASMTLLIALSEKAYAHFQQLVHALARNIERLRSPQSAQQQQEGRRAREREEEKPALEGAHDGLLVMSFRALLALKRFAAVEKQVARSLGESSTLYDLALRNVMDLGVAELLKLLKRAAEVD
ncbi:hypothetical protein MPH_10169 [Macrophomina phaseolina MS6]|uniref:Uncharacterized protein n=1 Tax=Macrophomina phaseolina (strain MS6) TaxID=1126212 RepID=K2QS32_MACPH|nr:hypothetical protein MPH_10169 [Macrophomina phaseolina MS6]